VKETDHLDEEVWFSSEYFHLEVSVDIVNRIEFVDYCSKTLVFLHDARTVSNEVTIEERSSTYIENDSTDKVFVRKILIAEVEMSCKTIDLDEREQSRSSRRVTYRCDRLG